MRFNYSKIPSTLKNMSRWVLWKIGTTDKGKKTKMPINANTGAFAKSNDSTTWSDFKTALKNCDVFGCDGLGFMLGNGVFGVDLDFHDSTNEQDFEKHKNEFIEQLCSYTEYSQSGKGIHIICKGNLPVGNRRKGDIEMYDSARFFALTGDVVEGTEDFDIEDRTKEIAVLHEKYLKDKPVYTYRAEYNNTKSVRFLSDREVLDKAMQSKNGHLFNLLYNGHWEGIYPSQSEGDAAFCVMLAFWTNKDKAQMDRIFRHSNLYRQKWNEKRGQKTYGEYVLDNAISKCTDTFVATENDNSVEFNVSSGKVEIKKNYALDDTGNAERFVDTFGSVLKYNIDLKSWVIYDGKTWVRDYKQQVKKYADNLIERMKEECLKEEDKDLQREKAKNIKHLSSTHGKDAMLKEAVHLQSVATKNYDFDKQDYLINCKNCVVDLRNGEILDHDKDLMLSKNTNIDVDLNGTPTLFIKFLHDIFSGDTELVDFMQKAIGYSLTGHTKEQCLFQHIGNGSNGKSVLFNVIYDMLGSYALNIQVESILQKGANGGANANPDIARLNGVRFVRTTEPSDGQRFNEGLIKQLTGADVITARNLYADFFDFVPKFKLWIACNHRINVRGTDKGIWRRMKIIEYKRTFEGSEIDYDLEDKLKNELPQILGWAVKGAQLWYKNGLGKNTAVEIATQEYRNAMDLVGQFLDDCVVASANGKEKSSDIYNEFKNWAKNGNEWVMSQQKFGIEMAKRFDKKCIGGSNYYYGLTLKSKSYVFIKE